MATSRAIDYALPNGRNGGNPAASSPGGMTNEEKVATVGMVAKDEDQGAAVHAFDPDATPEQKAAAAGQARAQLAALPRAHKREEREGGREVAIDTSVANGPGVPKPTVTLDDVDQASRAEGQGPGALQAGWRQVAGLDATAVTDTVKEQQVGFLADYLSEQLYGSWYHNAAIIAFAILTTRFLTVLRLGWGWIILVFASCASYYTVSITRTRHRARDDIQRELVKTRLVTETESADWLNGFFDRFWLIYEPVLSQTIVASVDAVLAANTPSFLESIRLTTFTLGTKAPRIDYVRTFPKTPEDVVIMDWAVSFTPNDLLDITPRQALKRVNPKIVLSIRVGKGGISKSLPILLEDMSFTGRMRIKLKLMTNFPHVQTIDMSFIEKPTFDYVLKPLGGETFGFDINNIPGLAPFIRDQVHANLGPMMYDPNVFTIDLQALLSGTPLDAAIGVLKVTLIDARGLKAVKLGGGAPDPYVSVALGAKPALCQTKTVESSSNPSWHETHFVLINSLADVLNLGLWDYNDHRPDSLLGTVAQELATLNDDAEQEGIIGKIIGGGKDRGELRYDLSYFPVLTPVKNPDGTFESLPETQTGIVRLTIHQAKDIDITREHGDLSPFAKVYLGASKHHVHKTPTLKHANQPIWESHTEFLVPEKHSSVITIKIIDSKEFASDPTLGTLTVKLTDLLEAKERQQDWYPLKGSRAGKIRLTAEWKPVAMAGSMSGAAAYVPPIGILRIWLKNAVDVKNVEVALGGKSDPYVRVMGANKTLARTEVVNNNLNPEWDQIVYVPVHNLRENLILELMDYQNIGKDRSLGYVELKVADCAEARDDQKYPYTSKGHQVRSEKIKLDKNNSYKGTLMFEVDFKPAVSLRGGVAFEAEKSEIEMAVEEAQKENGSIVSSLPDGTSPISVTANGSVASVHSLRPSASAAAASVASLTSSTGHKPTQSIGDTSAVIVGSRAGGEATPAEDPEKGVEMSREELLATQSGVLVFQVVSGQLARRGSLEVMFDDGYWPSFTSTRARSNHQKWDQIGEGFVRELDFSRIWLRINAADDSEKEDIVAEFRCDTKDFLEQCLSAPADFLLSQADGSNRTVIKMSARYVPIDIKLEPRESINNMGVLRVDVVEAKHLMAVDRGGKSDPNVTFYLNGLKVFKSETKKKTLSPVWNESFEVMVPSRVAGKFTFEVADWDRVGTATTLGTGTVDLASLEPFEAIEVTLPVTHEKAGGKGTIHLRLMFQPEIIARSRQKTSTFSTAGRAITQIGGVPLGVGKGVIQGSGAVALGVGHGIGSVGGFAGRRIGLIKRKDKSGKEVLVQPDGVDRMGAVDEGAGEGFELASPSDAARTVPAVVVDGVAASATQQPLPPGQGGPNEPGLLSITVLGAKDLKGSQKDGGAKPYVQLKLGGKTHKTEHVKGSDVEWNESFSFNVGPGSTSFKATVYDHHTLGKDPELGEAEVEIWRHLQPAIQTAEVKAELTNGTGLLHLRLDWTPGSSPLNKGLARISSRGRTPSINSGKGDSPGKFSLRMSRSKKEDE